MARWYKNSQTPIQTIRVTDSNPISVPFSLQVACLPVGESGGEIKRRKWKVVTANVLTFQPTIEKEAAGFFASGRRLEFEECIANLNVDSAGIQEGWQRSSVTRQVGRYFVVSASAGVTVALKRGYITNTSSFVRAAVSTRSDSVACTSVRSNLRDKTSSVTVVGKTRFKS